MTTNSRGAAVSKHFGKRVLNLSIALVLLIVGGVASQSARAADCPYPVADQTANDHPKDVIRLISPVLTDDNSIHRYDFESQFTIDCDWYGVGMHFKQVYVPFGLTSVLTYHVTDPAGVPLVNTLVTLRVNKGYSNSNAAVRVYGVMARPAPTNASDGANIRASTDINGNVTFVVASPDDCTTYGGTLPNKPTRYDSDTPNDRNQDPSRDCFTQIVPSISGEKTDTTDWVELHYFNATGMNYSLPSGSNVYQSLQAPVLGDTNSISKPTVTQAYTPVGGSQILTLSFNDAAGSFVRNQPVRIKINSAGSGSNAFVGAGIFGQNGYGDAISTSSPSAGEIILNGTTDAFGSISILLKNSDSVGEPKPATITSPVPSTNQKSSLIVAQIDNHPIIGKGLELHYVSGLKLPGQSLFAPTNVVASANGLVVTVSWVNDLDNQGLVSNSVFDADNNLVCSTGVGQSCSFSWDVFSLLKSHQYYVIPSSDSFSGPASALSNSLTPSTSKPALYSSSKNWHLGDSAPLLALGFPSNVSVVLRDGTQVILLRTDGNGALSTSYQIYKPGITTLTLKVGSKSATLKVYSPYDKVTSALCKVGKSIKVSFAAMLPGSTVDVQVSDNRPTLTGVADANGNTFVNIDCIEVGGFKWTSMAGDDALNSGGFTVR
jgi:hypothetical protein